MQLLFRTVLVLTLATAFNNALHAYLIVGTEPEGNGGYGVGFSFDPEVNLIIGQEFTLNQAITLDGIHVFLNGNGTGGPQSNFTLYLTDAIGDTATAANVLATMTGTFPDNPPGTHAPVSFYGFGPSLDAGTYYLVITSDGGAGSGWGSGAPIIPTTYGTVGSAFVGIVGGGAVGDYTNLDPGNPQAGNVNFQFTRIPEPASIIMLAAFVFMGMKVRKR